jgi:hypothetical protein
MKHHPLLALFAVFALLFTGCVIRSVNPWFAPETRAATPSPAGFWTDANAPMAVFFGPIEENRYSVLLQDGKTESRFTASLHRIDSNLFLVATAPERQDLGVFATVPAHLLFRVDWGTNQFRLFPLNLTDFQSRLARYHISPLEGGDTTNGFILTATTDELTEFLRAEFGDPTLFSEKPLYTFRAATAQKN